jgi:peptidyl-prolyl cis-trans isomerase SurA
MNKISKRYKTIAFVVFAVIAAVSFVECNRASKTLVEIGDEKVTLGEFEKQFLKTVTSIDSARNTSLDARKQFLNLYINFRLKVKDARERGLLNSPDMQKEIAEYTKNFAPTYLIDKEVVEPEIEKLYERKKDEVRASHILITLPEKASVQDSIMAYEKADTIIRKLKDGEDFGQLAYDYSQDRTAKQNRGDLYYFTAGMTVQPFEDAVYNLKVGEFTTKPVRSQFGLHIIKLTDRKPRFDAIRASHILIQDKRDSLGNIIDSLQTYEKALDVYNRAKNGEDWVSLVTQFSEDPGTKQNGGDLGFFDRRRMTQPFDSAVFGLKVGQIAGPVRSQFGWHIIKKTGEKPYPPFEEQKENLKNEYKRTKQFKDDYQKYVDELKKEYDFKIADDGYNYLRSRFDSTKLFSDINFDSIFAQTDKNKLVASFDGGQIKISDIQNFLNVNRDYQRNTLNAETVRAIINSAAEQSVLNKKADDEKVYKDDEYKSSMRDYENGLLVFRVDQDELWTKVKINDADMQSYYDANKTKFATKDSTGQDVFKKFDDVKPEISNELQQSKFKEIENNYIESLKKKYPVTIHEDVLQEAFKE